MKKKVFKVVLAIIFCWVIFVTAEGFRLIGSRDPGKYPLIYIGGAQIADTIAYYESLGFSQTYFLKYGDLFLYGEFRVLGIKIAEWYD